MSSKHSVVVVGANIETEIALQKLIEHKVDVVGCVTLPSGVYNNVSDYKDLHELLIKHSINPIDTNNINDVETISQIQSLDPDYIFILGWNQLIDTNALKMLKALIVGSHPTPLPLRRGRAPIAWTILEGHTSSAVTLFEITDGVDSGPILLQQYFTFDERVYAADLYMLVADVLASSFVELYTQLCANKSTKVNQIEFESSFRSKRKPEDGFINFEHSVPKIDRLVRAVSKPYPGAYFYYRGERIIVWEVELQSLLKYRGTLGQILSVQNDTIIVQCLDGCIGLSNFEANGFTFCSSGFKVGDKLNFNCYEKVFELEKRVSRLEALFRK